MSKKIGVINIDYTVDFIAETGALNCGEYGRKIENRSAEIIKEAIDNGDFVVMAVDGHKKDDQYHPETSLYPPHNIFETTGRELYGLIYDIYEENKDKIYYMDKTRYSAFAGTDLEIQLRARGIEEIHLTGVCTDICVLHTVVDAFNKGFKIVIHKDAVQSFNQQGHEWALQHFEKTLGATIMENGIILKSE